MSRRVTHDGQGTLEVRFPFDRALVDRIKSLPHRRWNATARCWIVPDVDVVALVDLLRPAGFRFRDDFFAVLTCLTARRLAPSLTALPAEALFPANDLLTTAGFLETDCASRKAAWAAASRAIGTRYGEQDT